MVESKFVVSAYTLYRHLQQYCSHPSKYLLGYHYLRVFLEVELLLGTAPLLGDLYARLINPLPDDKILLQSKLKALADAKTKVTQKLE